jgi:hypothetical protein
VLVSAVKNNDALEAKLRHEGKQHPGVRRHVPRPSGVGRRPPREP